MADRRPNSAALRAGCGFSIRAVTACASRKHSARAHRSLPGKSFAPNDRGLPEASARARHVAGGPCEPPDAERCGRAALAAVATLFAADFEMDSRIVLVLCVAWGHVVKGNRASGKRRTETGSDETGNIDVSCRLPAWLPTVVVVVTSQTDVVDGVAGRSRPA